MSYEIAREEWNRFCDVLSKRRFEWKTEIEVLSPTLGDQTLNISLPFNGITVEGVGEKTVFEISVGDDTDHHQSHNIKNPIRMAFLGSEELRGDVLNIEEADGTKTLIRFVEPIDVLVGFTKIDVVAISA